MNDVKKNKITKFKELLTNIMVRNFENDGCLVPVLFYYKDDTPIIVAVPNELLNSVKGKLELSSMIKRICQEPNVFAAGLIIEAYGKKIDVNSELHNLIQEGNLKISELKEKQDIIMMIFSSPESEELIAFEVFPETKTVGDRFSEENAEAIGGVFSNFFTWNKN